MSPESEHVDLLIIGGGVLGTFHALHALERGLRVKLVERNQRPQGATVRNFGQVVPSGLDSQWQKYGRESLSIYRQLQARFDISLRHLGSIYLASDEEELTLLEELHQRNHASDYASELWTPAQCVQRFPQLRTDYCRGGLFFPEEVSVDPRFMIARLHQYLKTQPNFAGHFSTCVYQLFVDGHRICARTTTGQEFYAERAIICSGNEYQLLFPDQFRTSDLQLVKLQMCRLASQPQVTLPGNVLTGLTIRRYESFAQCPSWTTIKAREATNTFSKQWGVHILFKQESDGTIVLGDSHEYAPIQESDKLDFQIRDEMTRYFIEEGQKIFELPTWKVDAAWYGLYCQTEDPSGIFRRTIDDRIHIVTGIGGKGMTSSAGYAKHNLAEIYGD